MTWTIDTISNRRPSARLTAWLAIWPMLALGTFAVPANAQWGGHNREYSHNSNGGYYRAPPVVYGSRFGSSYYGSPHGSSHYGSPNYSPPPVVYGPGIGLPGVDVHIR